MARLVKLCLPAAKLEAALTELAVTSADLGGNVVKVVGNFVKGTDSGVRVARSHGKVGGNLDGGKGFRLKPNSEVGRRPRSRRRGESGDKSPAFQTLRVGVAAPDFASAFGLRGLQHRFGARGIHWRPRISGGFHFGIRVKASFSAVPAKGRGRGFYL